MPENTQTAKPETATKLPTDIDGYREQRRRQLLDQCRSISTLNPDVNRRKLTHIINTAVTSAFG